LSPHHRRRKGDPPDGNGWRLWRNSLRWWVWYSERVWQDLVPLIAIILAWIAVTGTESEQERQREGRGIAIDVLCGGLYGVETAGEKILTDTLPETEGLRPPQTQREREVAKIYARAYATVISTAVINQAGVAAEDVLRKDGTIDCDALKDAARAQNDGS
jgi:hypothetical protein